MGFRLHWSCAFGLTVMWFGTIGIAYAHPGRDEQSAAAPQTSARSTLRNAVEITTKDGYRTITSNGIPNHPTGAFPNRGNPNSVAPQQYQFRVPLEPKANEKPTPMRGSLFGVALNGVVFDPGTAEFWNGDRRGGWNYEALGGGMNLGIDENHAHVQPSGAYHYHGIPAGLVEQLTNERGSVRSRLRGGSGDKRVAQSMLLIGYAADGFPIYGPEAHGDANDASSPLKKMKSSYRLRSGTRPGGSEGPGGKFDGTFTADFEYVQGAGDLDECNGRTGVTPEYPGGTYYYVLTDEFPFIPRFYRGTPDESFRKNEGLGGPGARGGPAGAAGPGPAGGGGAGGPGGRRPPPRDGQRGNRPPPPR